MAKWKKVVVSGSSAELSSLTLDTQLAVTQGGTGLNSLSGQAGKTLTVNSGADGFTFADASAPAGTISSSATGDAQGQIKLNGQNVDISAMQTSDSPQFAGIELGNATDTTISRVAAGQIAVEGDKLLRASADYVFSSSASDVYDNNFPTGSSSKHGTLKQSATTGIDFYELIFGLRYNTAASPGSIINGLKYWFTGSTNQTTLGTVTTGSVDDILPTGTVSGSSVGTAQGQFKLNGVDVSVKDLSTTSDVQFAALTATGDTNLNGNVTLGNQTTDTVVVNGDLTVKGTASFQNTENLLVKDAFITLNSGSNTATDDGGIVVETSTDNGGQGPAFAWNGGDGRWGVASLVQSDATSYAADAFMSAVVVGSNDTVPTGTYAKKGNIFIGSSEDEIWIYGS